MYTSRSESRCRGLVCALWVAYGASCDTPRASEPCRSDCIPQPCTESYALPGPVLRPSPEDDVAWSAECDEIGPGEQGETIFSCGGEADNGRVLRDSEGRVVEASLIEEGARREERRWAYRYDGAVPVYGEQSFFVDGEFESKMTLELRLLTGSEVVTGEEQRWEFREPGEHSDARFSIAGREIAIQRRSWDERGLISRVELRGGDGEFLSVGSSFFFDADGTKLGSVETFFDDTSLQSLPNCERLGEHSFFCRTVFSYSGDVMTEYSTGNYVTSVSDNCCAVDCTAGSDGD